jgi:hypothetical protein
MVVGGALEARAACRGIADSLVAAGWAVVRSHEDQDSAHIVVERGDHEISVGSTTDLTSPERFAGQIIATAAP